MMQKDKRRKSCSRRTSWPGKERVARSLLPWRLDEMITGRPQPTAENLQNLCLDKGYDYPQVHELVEA